MSSSTNWYYRLGTDGDNTFLWTGSIVSAVKVTKAQVREAIRRKERLTRLPSRTIIMSQRELCEQKGLKVETDNTAVINEALNLINKYC